MKKWIAEVFSNKKWKYDSVPLPMQNVLNWLQPWLMFNFLTLFFTYSVSNNLCPSVFVDYIVPTLFCNRITRSQTHIFTPCMDLHQMSWKFFATKAWLELSDKFKEEPSLRSFKRCVLSYPLLCNQIGVSHNKQNGCDLSCIGDVIAFW